MSALERIAFYQGRRDEVPNQELARDLARRGDRAGIAEIAAGLRHHDRNVRSDCLKVLYEAGYDAPALIAPYARDFIGLLGDKSNRMVWGAMIALGTIAPVAPKPIRDNLHAVLAAMEGGSLITQVWGVRAAARAAAGSAKAVEAALPRLRTLLEACKARDVPTHLESMLPILAPARWKVLAGVVEGRKKEMTASHLSRLKKVMKSIPR
jgi:hypothetical protein